MTTAAPQRVLDNLNSFAKAVWGNPYAILKCDTHSGVEHIDLSAHIDTFQFLFGPAARWKKVLVREEYRTALQALETNIVYQDGAYVTGQPGIGKTLFLAYVLVARLGKEQSIAYQFPNGAPYYVLFREAAATIHHENDTNPVYRFAPMWGLSNSNSKTQTPLAIFYHYPDRVKAIQATSLRETRWKGWSKEAGANCYIMDIWSVEEIADLARLLNLDVERLTFLAKEWGGAPRNLLKFLQGNTSDQNIGAIYRDVAPQAVQKCWETISSISAMSLTDDALSKFYFTRPGILSGYGIDRMLIRVDVPTTTLCCLLAEALRDVDNRVRLSFFRALKYSQGTHSAAGYIFENWFHSFFLAPRTIECHWVQGLEGVSTLDGTDTLITGWSAVKAAQPRYYWIAPNGIPGIDCALVLETEICAIQFVLSSELAHKSPVEGLQVLQRRLPDDLKDLPWRVLFVGDDAFSAEAAARHWVGKVTFSSRQAPLAIGWSALDPVEPRIPWKEYRNNFESQLDKETSEASMQMDE